LPQPTIVGVVGDLIGQTLSDALRAVVNEVLPTPLDVQAIFELIRRHRSRTGTLD